MKNEISKKRNSNIELLKIIGIVLIILSHSVPLYGNKELISYVNINLATNDINEFILILFRYLGMIGNIIFVMSSAYFLIDSKKINMRKICYIIVDCFVISVAFLAICLLTKIDISGKEIIKQFMPITFQNNWFICCYLMLYIIHPVLNNIIEKTDKKSLLRINLILIILYCVITLILGGKTYYYNNLVGFIIIYLIVAYNKLYLNKFSKNVKLNLVTFVVGIFMLILLIGLTNILGLKLDWFENKMLYWDKLNNLIFIIIGISIFNLFNRKSFYSKAINYISSLSLLIYIIHENVLFRTYIKPLFFQYTFKDGRILLWVIIEAMLLGLFGISMSIIYKKTLQKLVYRIGEKLLKITNKYWSKFENFLIKID